MGERVYLYQYIDWNELMALEIKYWAFRYISDQVN